MFLVKLFLWCLLYPITFVGYFSYTVVLAIAFLFNSPVDIWNMIGKSLEETEEKG